MIRTTLTTALAAAALATGAGGAFLANAGTALAPEPAMLSSGLYGASGASAPGRYLNSGIPTDVLQWPRSYTFAPSVAAGTPCSSGWLAAGEVTGQVIVANGNYRKCV